MGVLDGLYRMNGNLILVSGYSGEGAYSRETGMGRVAFRVLRPSGRSLAMPGYHDANMVGVVPTREAVVRCLSLSKGYMEVRYLPHLRAALRRRALSA